MHSLSLVTFLTLGVATVSAIPENRTTAVNMTSLVLQYSNIIISDFHDVPLDISHRVNSTIQDTYLWPNGTFNPTAATSALNATERFVSTAIQQQLVKRLRSAADEIRSQYVPDDAHVDNQVSLAVLHVDHQVSLVDNQVSLAVLQEKVQSIMQYPFAAALQLKAGLTPNYNKKVVEACEEDYNAENKQAMGDGYQDPTQPCQNSPLTLTPGGSDVAFVVLQYQQDVNAAVNPVVTNVIENLAALVTSVAGQAVFNIALSYCTASSSAPATDCQNDIIW